MKTSTPGGKHGIQWTACMQLDDMVFVDDLALLSHTHERMHTNTTSVAAATASVILNIHKGKSKIFKYNTENICPITLDAKTGRVGKILYVNNCELLNRKPLDTGSVRVPD
ncbi:unnamed protein product [Schistosoma margrebowiei]|uniref:Uncharacterized protein n=1 Tax=Schistosoma margrebowiei TaxID=48269 RepID=A0A183M0K8_9TREM|nr:unnamed protein product [Schistosoma margrebowiei]